MLVSPLTHITNVCVSWQPQSVHGDKQTKHSPVQSCSSNWEFQSNQPEVSLLKDDKEGLRFGPPRISSQPCQLINANGGLFVGKLHTKGLITSHLHFFSNNLQYFLFKSQPNLLFYEMKKNLWAVSHNKSREWVGSFHILTLNMEMCG